MIRSFWKGMTLGDGLSGHGKRGNTFQEFAETLRPLHWSSPDSGL